MKKIAVATVIALGALSSAQAQYYGELAYIQSTVKSEAGFKEKPGVVRAIVGYELNPNLAIEGALGVSAGSKTVSRRDRTAQVKITDMVGLYAKPKFEITNDIEVFARLGMTRGTIKATWSDGEVEQFSATKLSYGVGASYQITPKVSVNADYMHYLKKEGVTSRGFTVGMGYKF